MKNEEIQIPFYTLLQESRRTQGIDLQTISDDSKINIKYLEAIENGNLDIVPTTYIRLFIRSYAQYLKLDSKEVLNKFEDETNLKSKNIFKSFYKKNVGEKTQETRKIYKQKNDLNKENIVKQNLTFEDSNNISSEILKFNLAEKYFLKPKQIFSSIFIVSILLLFYLLISYLSNQQRIINLNESSDNNENLVLLNHEQESNVDNTLLTSNNFNQNKLVKKESHRLKYHIGLPYNFQIVTKEKTKLYISYDEQGSRKEECNIIAKKDSLIKLKKDSNIYFDLWNAKHVEIAIENKSITKYLGKDNYIVRGSFRPTDKLLYLEFYNY